MSVLLDLDPATLGLADGDPWSGDATWTNLEWGGEVKGATVNGFPALRYAFTTAPGAVSADTPDLHDPWTLHVVGRITNAPDSYAPGVMGPGQVLVNPDKSWMYMGLDTPITAGVHVLTLTFDGEEASVYLNGLLIGATAGQSLTPSLALGAYGPEMVLDVLRLVLLDEIPATLLDDIAALKSTYGVGGDTLTAHGAFILAGAAELYTLDPETGVYPGDEPPLPDGTPGGAVEAPEPPEPQLPPAGVPDPVIWRRSETYGPPTVDANGNPVDWAPSTVVFEPFARPQIVVEGVDITYYLNAPTPLPQVVRVEPFGSAAATIQLPQLTAFHALPEWCIPGASVDYRLVRSGGGYVHRFAGVVDTFGHNADTGVFTVECTGVVFVSDWQLRTPGFTTKPRDVGRVIAEALNTAVSRRHKKVPPVVTGVRTGVLGGWEPRVTGYIQQLLATAVDSKGRHWTVKCPVRQPVIEPKDLDTVSWTVRNGQPGVKINLQQDWSQAPNVIYGEGVAPNGGRWRNAVYPNWKPDDTPAWPMGPDQSFHVGTRDADTTTGSGVSDWQRKVGLPVTGRYSLDDRKRCMEVQRAAGIQVDGSVGPQTWAATFGTGSNVGTLECFYMPLAFAKNVMPRLYGPDGDDLEGNPDYDATVLRVEEKIDFGQGVTKSEGKRGARAILRGEANPGWAGTITLEADPRECSKHEVFEGSNGRILGFRGESLKVHVARVEDDGQTVQLTVDTNARDYPRLNAIRDRERNATDPAKAAVRRLTKGDVTEARATFDAESPAGQVPRHALFANLWTVIRIPFGSYGSIVRTAFRTSGPAAPFALAVFSKPITASKLLALVGNPLTAEDNPWSEAADELDKAGLLMAWGWAKQPAGYYPHEYANPEGSTGKSPTGRLVDDSAWEYASTQPPWLWVAEIATAGCHIEGRFLPGAD